ncbi:MAG: MerR family transcriptional regulator [Elusimicrobiota bacterium]
MIQETRPLLPDKEFFNIGEASRILRIPSYTLRYWESQFRVFRPTRRHSGHRRFTRRDLETAFLIRDLLHIKKMTVAGARKALARRQRGGRIVRNHGESAGRLPQGAVKLVRQVRDELKRLASELST